MHLKRWITAIVLLPLLFLIILKGSTLLFSILMAFIAVAAMTEYFSIVSFPLSGKIPLTIKFFAHGVALALIAGAQTGSIQIIVAALAMNIILLSMTVIADFSRESSILDSVSKQIQGVVYIPLFLSMFVLIRNSENGALWVVWLWLIIGAGDTGAFYCGMNFGKRALAPKVSPKKTVEGAIGGLFAAVLVGIVFSRLFLPEISPCMVVLFAAVAAAAGQIGDLFESALKRAGNIKDSGKILPGHGGILDRIDGLLFAVPVAYVFKVFLI
ncbi:MAG: phosphatidate cytidylyltransferase [Thermodesulfobacteriota bacterium]|nr:phosphatidate cytidylyltransferase [Thermodesulfobacteriota bacterium]